VLKSYFSGHRNVKMHTQKVLESQLLALKERELLKKMKDRGSGQQDVTVQR
jgi:hypothetical protein